MKTPLWLSEFHRRWQKARARSTAASSRPFGLKWDSLLESAGVSDTEGGRTAVREAERFESDGFLLLKRHRYRNYLIERIVLPLHAEDWLQAQFGGEDSRHLLERSLSVLENQPAHPTHPELWSALLSRIRSAFLEGRAERPFTWRDPDGLKEFLGLLRDLTSHEWGQGTPVRAVSVDLGRSSKELERRQRSIRSALTSLFGRPTGLDDLGIVLSEAMLLIQGPLVLHFQNGDRKDFSGLAPYALSNADLQRAIQADTECSRLLTVENAKTTFRQFAAASSDGGTLLVASSFPTDALAALLRKLPHGIEHHHFGDTDPHGYLILQSIRRVSPRPVMPFWMNKPASLEGEPLSFAENRTLDTLLSSEEMSDCFDALQAMRESGKKGQFEQESLGPPQILGWPFFER